MKYVYLDGSSGLSGDMILGALLDLGVETRLFKEKMSGLRLPVEISARRVKRGGMAALKVNVRVDPGKSVERTFSDVEKIVRTSPFPGAVKDRALAVFERLFHAEAKVHGRKFRETHLHEAGADDALVDIVGAVFLLDELGIGEMAVSPLNVGSGWVETSHGRLSVPPPAVAELLKGAPVYSAWVEAELVTPTGAAIVSTLAGEFRRFPELVYERIGTGAGGRDHQELPNVLRAFYGDSVKFAGGRSVYLVETTLDDASPQVLAHFLERAFEEGALDATLSSVVMKKNRLGTKLSVLAPAEKMDGLIEAVFRETTSLGVRYFPVERRVLERDFVTVRVAGRPVAVKTASMGGREVNALPEYDDCLVVSRETGRPLKEIVRAALREYDRRRTGRRGR
jgi:uncharacterized protein (TIGR00299 family) protein